MEKTVKNLNNKELVDELEEVEEKISNEHKILSTYKKRKTEIEEEMKIRLKEREEK